MANVKTDFGTSTLAASFFSSFALFDMIRQRIEIAVDINAQCPSELTVQDGSSGTIGCRSACVAFNRPEYCCTRDYSTPETFPPTDYSRVFKDLCPENC
ncbi:putative Thaumatin family [Helianthus anomalus]